MVILQFVVAAVLAAAAYLYLDPTRWLAVIFEVMLAHSILAAAVLFRLGRGLPQFAHEHLSAKRLRELSDAYKKVVQRLGWMLAIIVAAIACLAMSRLSLTTGDDLNVWSIGRELMSVSVFVSSFAVIRIVALVVGDIGLVRLQSELIEEEARLRWKEAAQVVSEQASQTDVYQTPKNYGGLIPK